MNKDTSKPYTSNLDHSGIVKPGGVTKKVVYACCHDGDRELEPLYSFKGRHFYLGGTRSEYLFFDGVIDLAHVISNQDRDIIKVAPSQETKEALSNLVISPPPFIRISWTDFGTLPVKPEFWQEIVTSLPEGKILICCSMGHGRSATALGCIVMANQEEYAPSAEVVARIRKIHCDRAVETMAQECQIQEIEEYFWEDEFKNQEIANELETDSPNGKQYLLSEGALY
jgi:hypothetical protein